MKAPKKETIETIKTVLLTALIAGVSGLIAGYFFSIDIHSNARQSVVQDMQVVKTAEEPKKADQ